MSLLSNQIMTEPDRQKDEDGFNIEESAGMDSAEQELFLNVRRSKSDQSFLGKLLTMNKSEIQKRPLILNINNEVDDNHNNNNGFKVFKKIKKQRKKNQSDYRKNICGYITKKIIRQFVSPNYISYVTHLCNKHDCNYGLMKSYYLAQIQKITGPSHIPGLLIPEKQTQIPIKNVFRQFFQWFLKQRYLRYLLIEGKMADKKAYIEYKNNILMGILAEAKEGKILDESNQIKMEESENSSSMQQQNDQENRESAEKQKKVDEKIAVEQMKIAKNKEKQKVKEKLVPMIPIVKKEIYKNDI